LPTAINSEIGRIISEIYDSAIDVSSLPQALASVARLVESDYAVVAIGNRHDGAINYRVTVPDKGAGPPIGDALCNSRWINFVLEQEPGRLFTHASMPGSGQVALQLNGSLQGLDFSSGVSSSFLLKKSGYGYIGLCRREGQGVFSSEDLASLELLLPHVSHAFEINRHVQERSVLHDVLRERYEQFSTGVVLLDREARVIFSNAWAKRLFREPGGIDCSEGRLSLATPAEDRKLAELITHCIRTANMKGVMNDGYVSVSRAQENKAPLSISVSSYVSPLDTRALLTGTSCVMLLLYDVERRNTARRYILEQLYRLSPSEAILATGLAAGQTLNEIADAQNVSRETLRSQLKRVFHKTHTNRQSDLVKLVLTGPGSLLV